jgi:hypothetical protein
MSVYKSWQYFLTVEADFAATARFVEIADANLDTYSAEYCSILLACGSEVDVACKRLCRAKSAGSHAANINDYRSEICGALPLLHTSKVLVPRYGRVQTPWSAWSGASNPVWWYAYNKVKHERDSHFNLATLRNVLDAVAALFVIVLYAHNAEGSIEFLQPAPQLMHLEEEPGTLALESDYKLPGFV